MRKYCLYAIAVLSLAGLLALAGPVSAIQSAEQSMSGSLTRGSRFTITITGLPNTSYYVWLPGTFTMSGEPYDRPPVIADGVENVAKDPSEGPYTIGSYPYYNGGGRTIRDDVAPSTAEMPNTNYYGRVTTDSRGQAVVEFQTSVYTGLRSYSVKVENPQAPDDSNLLVEQKVYSRSTSRPMINTPVSTIATATLLPSATTPPTPAPVNLPETTVPVTRPSPAPVIPPTTKSPLEAGIPTTAAMIGILALGKRR